MNYQQTVIEQLQQRNKEEQGAFNEAFTFYAKLIEENQQLLNQNKELETQNLRLTEEDSQNKKKLNKLTETGKFENVANNPELEKKVHQLQEDLTKAYKSNIESANTILQQSKHIKDIEDELKLKEMEVEDWRKKLQKANEKYEELKEQGKERDESVLVLQGELQALQVDFVKAGDKVKSLNTENQQLISRWISHKNQEAENMNEQNQIMEEMKQREEQERLEMEKRVEEEHKKIIEDSKNWNEVAFQVLDTPTYGVVPNSFHRMWEAHKGEVTSITYNTTGSMIGTGGLDSTVKIWDGRTGQHISTLSGANATVMCVAFSPDDDCIAGSTSGNTVVVWGVSTGRMKHTLTGHSGKVFGCTFSSDSSKLVTGSHDRMIKLWDLSKGYCVKTILCISSCNSVASCLDNSMVCSGHFDGNVRFWDPRSAECAHQHAYHTREVTAVTIAPDGNTVLSAGRDNLLHLIDIRTYEIVKTFNNESYRSGLNWNSPCMAPDGLHLCAGGADGKLFVWNVNSGKCVKILTGKRSEIIAGVSWSPDTPSLVACDKGGFVSMWSHKKELDVTLKDLNKNLLEE